MTKTTDYAVWISLRARTHAHAGRVDRHAGGSPARGEARPCGVDCARRPSSPSLWRGAPLPELSSLPTWPGRAYLKRRPVSRSRATSAILPASARSIQPVVTAVQNGETTTVDCGDSLMALDAGRMKKRQRRPVSRVLSRRRVLSNVLRGCAKVEPTTSKGFVIQQ